MLALGTGCQLDVDRGPDWLIVKVSSLDVDPANPPPLADEVWAWPKSTSRTALSWSWIKSVC